MAAGVPDTKGFIEAFKKSLIEAPEELAELEGLLKLLAQDGQQPDIEALLEALDFLDPDTRGRIPALAVAKPNFQFSKTSAATLRKKLHELILRKAVVQSADIGYLDSFADFFEPKGPLDVFSVNYDTCIELFCHTRRIKFTDGFGVEWRPSEFERADVQLRLIKLHGSVLWYETSAGACIRIPAIPQSGQHTLFTHETAQPLMLYPARKWAYAEPLLHNLELFRTRLSHPDTRHIIVVGYSFRDEHLRRIFFDVLRSNLEARIILISPDAWNIYRTRLEFLDDARTVPSSARNRVVCLPYGFEAVFPLLKGKLASMPSIAAVHGRTTYPDWGTVLESALRSEDMASAVAVAPKVKFTYFQSDGTKRAVKAYVMIRLLEAAQSRELLSAFPIVEARFREIISNIHLEIGNVGSNPQFKLDSRVVKRVDGTDEFTPTLDLFDLKSTLEWTLQELEPTLKAGNAIDAPIVKKLKTLRDRLAKLSATSLSGYEQTTLPYFSSSSERERYQKDVARAVEIISVTRDSTKTPRERLLLCQVESALLTELMDLPSSPSTAEKIPSTKE